MSASQYHALVAEPRLDDHHEMGRIYRLTKYLASAGIGRGVSHQDVIERVLETAHCSRRGLHVLDAHQAAAEAVRAVGLRVYGGALA